MPLSHVLSPRNILDPKRITANPMKPKTATDAITLALSAMAEATSYRMVWMAFRTWVRMSARLGGVDISSPKRS